MVTVWRTMQNYSGIPIHFGLPSEWLSLRLDTLVAKVYLSPPKERYLSLWTQIATTGPMKKSSSQVAGRNSLTEWTHWVWLWTNKAMSISDWERRILQTRI